MYKVFKIPDTLPLTTLFQVINHRWCDILQFDYWWTKTDYTGHFEFNCPLSISCYLSYLSLTQCESNTRLFKIHLVLNQDLQTESLKRILAVYLKTLNEDWWQIWFLLSCNCSQPVLWTLHQHANFKDQTQMGFSISIHLQTLTTFQSYSYSSHLRINNRFNQLKFWPHFSYNSLQRMRSDQF